MNNPTVRYRGRPRTCGLGAEIGPDFTHERVRGYLANEKDDVAAKTRLAGRGQHGAMLAQDIEIAQQRCGMKMIDDAAGPVGEKKGRANACDVGAQAGYNRLATL
jgi:hypothetical protein